MATIFQFLYSCCVISLQVPECHSSSTMIDQFIIESVHVQYNVNEPEHTYTTPLAISENQQGETKCAWVSFIQAMGPLNVTINNIGLAKACQIIIVFVNRQAVCKSSYYNSRCGLLCVHGQNVSFFIDSSETCSVDSECGCFSRHAESSISTSQFRRGINLFFQYSYIIISGNYKLNCNQQKHLYTGQVAILAWQNFSSVQDVL